ncbi:DUF3006 domain-containing protein [Halobacteriaceae bacterium SHR40]|uniref:DUF3006 domain-containing protein n=1 Tax=Halovenus amylolytica TaxID=2500550 RepID=UPI000FE3F48F
MTETYSAVVDRIVDGETAVLLLERDGETVDELTMAAEAVPEPGRHEGAVFEVTVDCGTVERFDYQPETEADRRDSAQRKFDRLSKRLGEDSKRPDEE